MAAGGTWSTQNKVRPGVYIRFRSKEAVRLTVGQRGTVALCVPLTWGPVNQVQELDSTVNFATFTGYDISDKENILFQQLLKGTNRTAAPTRMLLYRPEGKGAAKASAAIGALTATAKYPGSRGNGLTLAAAAQEGEEERFTVSLYLDGALVWQQSAACVEDLADNDWADFSGTGALTAGAGTPFTGGADGAVEGTDYTAFSKALAPYRFDVLLYDGDDGTVQQAMAAFVKDLAENHGRYCQLVVAGAETAFDSPYVVNLTSGVTLSDGTALTPGQAAWWLAGALAGAGFNQSLTAATYPDAVSVNPLLTDSQIEQGLARGEFLLNADQGTVRVEQDINTLVTISQEMGASGRKNRVVRLWAAMANDIYDQFVRSFLGVVHNNDQGRSRLKAAILGYLLQLQAADGIQNLEPDDVEVLPGSEADSVTVNLAIQSVDSVEKIYMTMELA